MCDCRPLPSRGAQDGEEGLMGETPGPSLTLLPNESDNGPFYLGSENSVCEVGGRSHRLLRNLCIFHTLVSKLGTRPVFMKCLPLLVIHL